MMNTARILLFALLVPFGSTACSGDADHDGGGEHTTSHDYEPTNGQSLVHLGDHKHMIEVTHDEPKGEIHVWVFDAHHNAVDKVPAAPALELEGGTTLHSEGSGSHYVFKNKVLEEHLHGLTFVVQVWERGEAQTYRKSWHAPH